MLSACGGGASDTPGAQQENTSNDPNNNNNGGGSGGGGTSTYTGPAPANDDIQAFRLQFWENVRGTNRCGSCHDVHNTATPAGVGYLLIKDNTDSALCLTCHNK